MNNEKIQQITYSKQTGMYHLYRGSIKDGKYTIDHKTHLTNEEKEWAKENCKAREETPYIIRWRIYHGNSTQSI